MYIYGCANSRHAVIAVTGTNIGLEISQNPANQMPQGKLGYQRSEVAIVPSNRSGKAEPGDKAGGASDVANVLMELRFTNIFSFNRSGIYQRLAVGETAVQQSVFMFARDERGEISPEAIKAIESVRTTEPKIREEKAKIAELYSNSNEEGRAKIKEAVIESGFESWDAFIDEIPKKPTLSDIGTIKKKIREKGITF